MKPGFHDFHRGDVFYADMGPPHGHEQGGIRPVLVIQNDAGNFHSPTIIVAAATSRLDKKPGQPTHVAIRDAGGLRPSMFMLEQVNTIDKGRVLRHAGRLEGWQMERVDAALLCSLGIPNPDRGDFYNGSSI